MGFVHFRSISLALCNSVRCALGRFSVHNTPKKNFRAQQHDWLAFIRPVFSPNIALRLEREGLDSMEMDWWLSQNDRSASQKYHLMCINHHSRRLKILLLVKKEQKFNRLMLHVGIHLNTLLWTVLEASSLPATTLNPLPSFPLFSISFCARILCKIVQRKKYF